MNKFALIGIVVAGLTGAGGVAYVYLPGGNLPISEQTVTETVVQDEHLSPMKTKWGPANSGQLFIIPSLIHDGEQMIKPDWVKECDFRITRDYKCQINFEMGNLQTGKLDAKFSIIFRPFATDMNQFQILMKAGFGDNHGRLGTGLRQDYSGVAELTKLSFDDWVKRPIKLSFMDGRSVLQLALSPKHYKDAPFKVAGFK